MTKYVLSTMTGGVNYAIYTDGPAGGLPIERKSIRIHGGAGLPSSTKPFGEHSEDSQGNPMWTPSGTVTPISDDDFAELRDHYLFKIHMDNGFVKVIDHDIVGNHKAVEKEVRTLEAADNSTQMTPKTAKRMLGKTAPKVKNAGDEEDPDSPKVRIKG